MFSSMDQYQVCTAFLAYGHSIFVRASEMTKFYRPAFCMETNLMISNPHMYYILEKIMQDSIRRVPCENPSIEPGIESYFFPTFFICFYCIPIKIF